MNEQASWKGHSFTLLVFGGIVFLCSIFFVLGMLVGRGQAQPPHPAESAGVTAPANTADADSQIQEEKSSNSTIEHIEVAKESKSKPETDPEPIRTSAPTAEPVDAKTSPKATPAPTAPAKSAKAGTPDSVKMIYLQVAALERDSAAKRQLDELRKAGFPAVIMGGDGPNALFRVQVGPFSNAADAEISKRKLEALGYKPIRK